jgi:hypothetical protein
MNPPDLSTKLKLMGVDVRVFVTVVPRDFSRNVGD